MHINDKVRELAASLKTTEEEAWAKVHDAVDVLLRDAHAGVKKVEEVFEAAKKEVEVEGARGL